MAEIDIKIEHDGILHPNKTIDIERHNEEVKVLWDDFNNKRNKRIPISFDTDESLWLDISGHTFKEFYTDPYIHLKTQLLGKAWFCQNVFSDAAAGLPDQWTIGVTHWMDDNLFFGCEVEIQEHDFAWGMPLDMNKNDIISYINDVDVERTITQMPSHDLFVQMSELAEDKTFLGRPIKVYPLGNGNAGIFTKTAEIWGLERICIDMAEDPDFAERLITAFADKLLAKIFAHRKAIERVSGAPCGNPFIGDDSIQMISKDMYDFFLLPCHEKLYSAIPGIKDRYIHLCGPAMQHYESLHRKLGVKYIDGPGLFADHAYYLNRFDSDFRFQAQLDNSVILFGAEAEIDSMLTKLINDDVKQPGRFDIRSYAPRGVNIKNIEHCYASAIELGKISA